MTYKLNPEISKITSPVELFFPDGESEKFESGAEVCSAVFENRYIVKELRGKNNEIVIILGIPENPSNEISFF